MIGPKMTWPVADGLCPKRNRTGRWSIDKTARPVRQDLALPFSFVLQIAVSLWYTATRTYRDTNDRSAEKCQM